jgi:hypothetical protein
LRCYQKSIYCVRTKEHLEQRLALDMYREQRAERLSGKRIVNILVKTGVTD